jgi:cytochrome c peroxidase
VSFACSSSEPSNGAHSKTTASERSAPYTAEHGNEAIETLGELMNYDQNISPNKNEACSFCHMPYAAFSGPIPSVNLTMIAYPGTIHVGAGKRAAQRYTYSPFFAVLQYNQVQGLFFGGNFFDSRSSGYLLRNPDAEQAQHPPVDTQEMGFADTACIAFRLSKAEYRPLFEQVWGKGSFDIKFPPETERICDTPGGRQSSARARPRFRYLQKTAPVQTWFMTSGVSPLTHASSPCRSAPSRRNSTPS